MPDGMTFICGRVLPGHKLKSLREDKQLTQGQVAYLLGVHQATIAKYEGRGVRNLWVIQKIAVAFEMTIEDLWD